MTTTMRLCQRNAQCKTRPTQTFHKLFTMINLNLPYLCVEQYQKLMNKD